MKTEEIYMRRAIELARLGFGKVSPNPMVGCVVLHDDRIVGEGFHQQFGGPHAEINAINSMENKGILPQCEVYVSLEPCAHHGKTPPCAELLAKHKVGRVIISNIDPNPLVAGKGIEILKKAGISIEIGLLEEEGKDLNKRFFTSIIRQRPYIILKWAATADGFIARKNYDSKWISNEFSRKLVHKWRAEEDAILVGKNTALHDNPKLNVRDWVGSDPLRVVVDHGLKLNSDLNLFDQKIPTVCYNLVKDESLDNLAFVKPEKASFIHDLLADLHSRKVQSIIIEGGASMLQQFIDAGLWDEARVFQSTNCFGDGIRAPQLLNAEFDGKEELLGDTLTYFKKK